MFYPFLLSEQNRIKSLLQAFVKDRVIGRFPVSDSVCCGMSSTVVEMDVYIDKKDKVWVVNLCPFDESMNSALFTFEELNELREANGNKRAEGGGEGEGEAMTEKESNAAAAAAAEEEEKEMEKEPVLRVVEEEAGTLPSEQMFYQVPMEMYSLNSTDQVSSFIQQLKKEKKDESEQEQADSKNESEK